VAVANSKKSTSKKVTSKTSSSASNKNSVVVNFLSGKGKIFPGKPIKKWLAFSVVVNILLLIALLFQISNPTSFTDASSGYTVDIPGGWVRSDRFEVFRATKGASGDPRAQLFAYGQRNATLGFYESPKEDRDSTLDQVTQQINDGQNQFILARFELAEMAFTANRGQKEDGTEFIRSQFTAKDAEGQSIQGEHLLLISKGGGVYSIVGFSDADAWPQVESEITQAVTGFGAP